jgi:hypothetical protein
MKKTYMKPQTVAMAIENETNLMAGSDVVNLTIDNSTVLSSDAGVGAKNHSSFDLWADDEEN